MNARLTNEQADVIDQPAPQDVLGAIIAYSNLETFPSDRQRLHDFIRHAKETEPGADSVLASFVFSKGADLYPFSRALENTIVHLQLGGIIYAKNPEFDRLGMTGEAKARMKAMATRRFQAEGLQVLENLGQAFASEFSA